MGGPSDRSCTVYTSWCVSNDVYRGQGSGCGVGVADPTEWVMRCHHLPPTEACRLRRFAARPNAVYNLPNSSAGRIDQHRVLMDMLDGPYVHLVLVAPVQGHQGHQVCAPNAHWIWIGGCSGSDFHVCLSGTYLFSQCSCSLQAAQLQGWCGRPSLASVYLAGNCTS
jgi:hypothetical protein